MEIDADDEESKMEVDEEDEESQRGPDSSIYRPQSTGLTRSSHAAPSKTRTDEKLAPFIEWIKSPVAVGRQTLIKNHEAFLQKFRTVLGKLAKLYNKPDDKLFNHLNRFDSCMAMFKPDPLNKFVMWIQKGDDGRQLQLRTVYNYLRTLVIFFQWKVNALGKTQFLTPLNSLQDVCKNLSLQKDKMSQDIAKKAARLATLPSVQQFICFMQDVLKPLVDQIRIGYQSRACEDFHDYEVCRNYLLMVLLFGVPPQRKQFLESVKIDNISYQDKFTILKLYDHKTARQYGPVVVALPPHYYDDFQLYLDIRGDFSTLANKSLFIQANGTPDPYLTRRFQEMTQAHFGTDVSIRDCRSIFINYAKKELDLKQMYELSRQMCHSFQMQQSQYRADDSIQRAITTLGSMHHITHLLSICSEDEDPEEYQREASVEALDDDGIDFDEDEDEGLDDDEKMEEFDAGPSDDQLLEFVESYNRSHETTI